LISLAGGGGGCDTAEAAFNCAAACTFWQECIDSELDVGNCASTCGERDASDPNFSTVLANCDNCIADNVGADCANADACRSACEDVVTTTS
jgi:hypothetical protein